MWVSTFINRKPASNLHHAIRVAEVIGYPLNILVSINFYYTSCRPDDCVKAFQLLRVKLGKWMTRPSRKDGLMKIPPTFVWVIERPRVEHFNCHWLIHVPTEHQKNFQSNLIKWTRLVVGEIIDEEAAIDFCDAPTPKGVGKYMLKGMHPGWAPHFEINHEPQGIVHGRRSGFTRNIGPTQKRYLRKIGKYPKARPYVKNAYR